MAPPEKQLRLRYSRVIARSDGNWPPVTKSRHINLDFTDGLRGESAPLFRPTGILNSHGAQPRRLTPDNLFAECNRRWATLVKSCSH